MKKYRNNKGFTLVELLVAVMILAFGVVPIISNFVQSGKLNQKAKINMNATNMAEDIMEGVSAYSATEVIKMFESEEDLIGKILANNFDSYDSHGDADATWNPQYTATRGAFNTGDSAKGSRQYAKKVVSGNAVELEKNTAGNNYYFYVKNLKQGKGTYDLRLTLATKEYAGNSQKGEAKKLKTKTTENVNGDELAELIQMSAPFDCTYRLGKSELEDAVQKIVDASNNAGAINDAGKEDIKKKASRDVTVKIYDDGAAGAPNYKVGIYCDYELPDAVKTTYSIPTTIAKFQTVQKDNISSMGGASLPRSLYLFYEGMPGSTGTAKDTFKIENTTGQEFTVYIIRTIPVSDDINSDTLIRNETNVANLINTSANETYNMNYRAKIIVKDSQVKTNLVTNINMDLSKSYDTNKIVEQQPGFSALRADISYISGAVEMSGFLTYDPDNPNLNVAQIFNGYSLEKKNYVYTAYLEVYEHRRGLLKKVATFDGGLVE